MSLEQDESRGEEARRLLDNPLYKEAYQLIEDRLVEQLAQAEITKERAEYLRTLIVAGRKHRKYMEQVLFGGTQAAMEIERQKTLRERVRDRFVRAV